MIKLNTPTGLEKFLKYWVKGWYYNLGYPSEYPDYYYHLYKEDTCWGDVSGPTKGVSDGICNMRDVNWIILHFGAKAPTPGWLPVDPKWVLGTYGCGGCDVYGDRIVNMRDIAFACIHFNHKNNTGTP